MAYMSVGFWILPAMTLAFIAYHILKPAGFDWETTPIFKDEKYFKTSPDFGQETRDGFGCRIEKPYEVQKTKKGETIH